MSVACVVSLGGYGVGVAVRKHLLKGDGYSCCVWMEAAGVSVIVCDCVVGSEAWDFV